MTAAHRVRKPTGPALSFLSSSAPPPRRSAQLVPTSRIVSTWFGFPAASIFVNLIKQSTSTIPFLWLTSPHPFAEPRKGRTLGFLRLLRPLSFRGHGIESNFANLLSVKSQGQSWPGAPLVPSLVPRLPVTRVSLRNGWPFPRPNIWPEASFVVDGAWGQPAAPRTGKTKTPALGF